MDPYASTGFFGVKQRGAWHFAHVGIKGPAQFRSEDEFGHDGNIEGAVATKVGICGGVESDECSACMKGNSTDREGDVYSGVGQ